MICLGMGTAQATTFTNSWTSGFTDPARSNSSPGDFDNDGDLDFLGGNSPPRILENNGSGSFTQVWSGNVGDNVNESDWADFDNDGDLDFFLATTGGQVGRMYRNDGSGVFTNVWNTTETDSSTGLALRDFDNDGFIDIAVGNSGNSNRVYRNNHNNTFTVIWNCPVTENTHSLDAADYDNDGDLDLLAGNSAESSRIYQNDGHGDFTSVWQSPNTVTYTAKFADMDGDGDLDVVAINSNQTSRFYRNDGGNTFTLAYTTTFQANQTEGAVGDIDEDGDYDVVIVGQTGVIELITNTGSFTFSESGIGTGAGDTQGVSLADIDSDGDMDVLTTGYFVATRAFTNPTNVANNAPPVPVLTPQTDAVSGSFTFHWASGGADDHTPANLIGYHLRLGTTPGGNEIFSNVFPPSMGNVGTALSWTVNLSDSGSVQPYFWTVQAIDNTGFMKSAPATEDNFFVGNPPPPFSSNWTSSPDTDNTDEIHFADLDGDGDLDHIAFNRDNQPTRVYRNNGGNNFSVSFVTPPSASGGGAIADTDNDGDLDFIIAVEGGASKIYLSDGTASGYTLGVGNFTPSPPIGTAEGVRAGDMDGDGDVDLLFLNGYNAEAKIIYRNDGNNLFTLVWTSVENETTMGGDLADMDGDGDLDVVVVNYNGPIRIYRNDGNFTFTSVYTSGTIATTGLAVGDTDNDGDLDLLIPVSDGGPSKLYRNDGNFTFTNVWTDGTNHDYRAAALADIDGDGDLDAVFGSSGVGLHQVMLNTGSNSFTNFFTASNSSEAVHSSFGVGDTDGDGDSDILFGHIAVTANRLYRNDMNFGNSPPPTPTLTAEPDGLSGSVNLVWASGGADDHTPANGITYNLRVGTTPGGNEVMSSLIQAGPGNVGHALSHSLQLSAGAYLVTYYWSVQAVDNTGFLTSSFAAEDSFVVSPPAYSQIWAAGETNDTDELASGDLDGDGDPDYVAFNNTSQPTRAYRNNGDNTFTLMYSSPNFTAMGGALADFDGDDDLDILVMVSNGSDRILRNDGGFSFTQIYSGGTAESKNNLAVGDLDGDGDLDYVTATGVGLSSKVYRNNGNNTFTKVFDTPDTNHHQDVKLGDLDGDGDLDMVFSAYNTPSLVYDNNGNFNFTLGFSTPQNLKPQGLYLGDTDNDGDLDMVFGGAETTSTRLYRNDGALSFTLAWTDPTPFNSRGISLVDLDSDGDLDMVQGRYDGNHEIFTNNGGNNFVSTFSYSAGLNYGNQGIGDMDGDGDSDILFGIYAAPVTLLKNNSLVGNSAPSAPTLNAVADTFSGSVSLTWNNDATDDHTPANGLTYNLRVGTTSGGNDIFSSKIESGPGNVRHALSWSLDLSAGASAVTYYWAVQAVDNTGFLSSAYAAEDSFIVANPPVYGSIWVSPITSDTANIVWGDYDNDGDLDQFVNGDTTNKRVLRNDGGNTFTTVWTSTETDPGTFAAWGDYDGDGDLDLLVGNYSSSNNRVYRNDGSDTFNLVWSAPTMQQTLAVVWSDYDNDGDLDQVVGVAGTNPNKIYRNDGNNTFNLAWSSVQTDNTYSLDMGDYDGDGDMDQLVGNYGGQPNRVYKNNGDGTFNLVWTSTETDNTVTVKWGDYDGDGDLDQAVGNYNQANRIYRNDGGDNFSSVWTSPESDSTNAVSWGDYDGDGDLDLFVVKVNNQANRVYRNDGSNTFTLAWTSTETEYTSGLSLGDSDGDGDLDLLVANTSTQQNRLYVNNLDPVNSPPTAPTLTPTPDGVSGSVNLMWSAASDSETPTALLTYNLRVGTTPGGNEIRSAKIQAGPGNVGQVLSVNLNLSASGSTQTYYWSVAAVDTTGFKEGAFAAEDSFTLTDVTDTTPPVGPVAVQDDGISTSNLAQLSASWDAATDSESAIAHYIVRVGTTAFGSDVVGDYLVAPSPLTLVTGLSLNPGQIYYVSVAAVNAVGLTGSFMASDGIQAVSPSDITPPVGPTMIADDGMAQSSSTTISVSWNAATDSESTITNYLLNVGTTPGGSDVAANFNAGPLTTTVVTGLMLVPGPTYYVTVWAVNSDGLSGSPVTTDGIQFAPPVDTTPPTGPTTITDAGATTNNLFAISVSWNAATDMDTAVLQYVLKVGTTPNGNDVNPEFLQPGNVLSASVPAGLTPGQTYYVSVAAVNVDGFTGSFVTSDGIQALTPSDTTPPVGPSSISDAGASTANLTGLSVSWAVATDGESGLGFYFLTVGTTPGGNDVNAGFSQPANVNAALVPAGLTPGQTYYVSVVAVNGAGLTGSMVTTDGIQALTPSDTTPPVGPASITDAGTTTSNLSGLSVSWAVATDAESGLGFYFLTVGTTAGGNDVNAGFSQPGNVNTAIVPAGLTPGLTYFVSVVAVNNSGLTGSVATTDGIQALAPQDTQAPFGGSISYPDVEATPPSVVIGLNAGADDQGLSTSALLLRVEASYDGLTCGLFTPPSQLAMVPTSMTQYTDDTLQAGLCYQYLYIVSDNAGNQTTYTNSAVVRVISPNGPQPLPTVTGVNVQPVNSNSAVVNWEPVSGSATYLVEVHDGFGVEILSASIPASETTFTVGDLAPGVSYSVTVFAVDGNNQLGLSGPPVEFMLPVEPPPGSSPLHVAFQMVDLGIVTPGTFSLQANQGLVTDQPLINVRLMVGPLVSSGTLVRNASTLGGDELTMVLTDPPVLPELNPDLTGDMMVKVMVPMGTMPGHFTGQQKLYADLNNDFVWQPEEPSADFSLTLEVPDFISLGGTCPVEEPHFPTLRSAGGNTLGEVTP